MEQVYTRLYSKVGLSYLLRCIGRFLVIFLVAVPSIVEASHIVGGRMSYRCLGDDNYEVSLSIYRDCFYGDEDAPFDNPATIGIFDEGTNNIYRVLKVPLMKDDTLTTNLEDECLFIPTDICVHTTTYRDTVRLPKNGRGYQLVYQRCCRNQTISNIYDPIETGATYTITLTPRAMELCNSSPEFKSWPPIFVCVDKPLSYSNSAIDIEGDSLVYGFYTPNAGASLNDPKPDVPSQPPYDTIVWIAPTYNLNNLLGRGTPLKINPRTGLITGLPKLQGQFVVGVFVEEYRNGELLSRTKRDFQYNVGMCSEVEALIANNSLQCENPTVDFANVSTNADSFKWFFDFENDSTLTSLEANPTYTYPDTGKYKVVLIAEPNSACVDTLEQEFYIHENGLQADFIMDVFSCESESLISLIDGSTDSISNLVAWNWTIEYGAEQQTSTEQNPVFKVPFRTNGTVSLEVTTESGCVQYVEKPFRSSVSSLGSLLRDTIYACQGDMVMLNPDEIIEYQYKWTPIDSFENNTIANPVVVAHQSQVYVVEITNEMCQIQKAVHLLVSPTPILDFATHTDCTGQTVEFEGQSINTNSIEWVIEDSVYTEVKPTYTFAENGTYDVIMRTGPNDVCQRSLSLQIMIEPKSVEPQFDLNYLSCEPNQSIVELREESIVENTIINNWFWEIGNQKYTDQNVQLNITTQQTLPVKLTVTTIEGCRYSTERTITFDAFPDVMISDSQIICYGDEVALNPQGDNDLIYEWLPNIGLNDTGLSNPIASPTEDTQYEVIIRKSGLACDLKRTVAIQVAPEIGLSVETTVIETCEPTATLRASASESSTLTWYNNTTNEAVGTGEMLTVDVSGVTTYRVEATNSFDCSEMATITVTGGGVNVELPPTAQVACGVEEVDLNIKNLDSNDNLMIDWTTDLNLNAMGDPIFTEGEHELKLTLTNQFGCTLEENFNIVVLPRNLDLSFDAMVNCNGATVDLTNTSDNGFNFIWIFNDSNNPNASSTQTNPSYTYTEPGTYPIGLTMDYAAACVDTFFNFVNIVEPRVIAAFDYQYINCGETATIQLTDVSTNSFNNTTGRQWTFSNGQSSTAINPTVTIDNSTELVVTLDITTANDCNASIVDTIVVNLVNTDHLPTERFVCIGERIDLNPTPNPNYQYNWSPSNTLDDAQSANPISFATTNTTYQVTVTDAAGICSVVQTVALVVSESINFSINNGNALFTCGEAITIEPSPIEEALIYQWEDAEGNVISDVATALVNSVDSALYYLTVLDGENCSTIDSVKVINQAVAVEVLTPNTQELCIGDPITIQLNNLDEKDILSYSWTIDGNITVQSGDATTLPTFVFQQAAAATVVLTVTNDKNCTEDIIFNFSTVVFEEAVQNSINVCPGLPTPINPLANSNYTYQWSPIEGLDDPTASNPIATLTEPITYTVTISEADGNCSIEQTVQVGLNAEVDASIRLDQLGTCGEPVSIAPIDRNPDYNYEWRDETGAVISNESVIFVNPSDSMWYYVQATDDLSCMGTDSILVINELVRVEVLTPNTQELCIGDLITIQLNNLDEKDILSYSWTIDGNITVQSGDATTLPTFVFQQAGAVTVVLTVTNDKNCKEDIIFNFSTITFEEAVQNSINVCPGLPTPINPLANSNYIYQWSPIEGLDDPTASNPIATLTEPITYTVTISEVDGNCSIEQTVQVGLNAEVDASIRFDQLGTCGEPIGIAPIDRNPDYTYEWKDETGTVISNESIIFVNPLDSMWYYVEATNDVGCTDVDSILVINQAVDIEVGTPQNLSVCPNTPISFDITNLDDRDELYYQWEILGSQGMVTGDSLRGPTIVFEQAGNTEVILTVLNKKGCQEQLNFQIETVDFTPLFQDSLVVCAGIATPLNSIGSIEYDYRWQPISGLDDPNSPNPIVTLDNSTIYQVTIAKNDGTTVCSTIEEVVVEVAPAINLSVIGDTTLCELTALNLFATSTAGVLIEWFVDENFENKIGEGNNLTVEPTETITYYVKATNSNACVETEQVTVNVFDFNRNLQEAFSICPNVPTILVTNGSEEYTYNWSPMIGLDRYDIPNPTATLDSSIIYTVDIALPNTSCMTTEEVIVAVNPSIVLTDISSDTTVCNTTPITLSANSTNENVELEWYNQGELIGTGQAVNITPSGIQTYTVRGTDNEGCIAEEQVQVGSYPINAFLADITEICTDIPSMVTIQNQDANQQLAYEWLPSDIVVGQEGNTVQIQTDTDQPLTVFITNQYDCMDTLSTVLMVQDNDIAINLSATEDTIYRGESTSLLATVEPQGNYTYEWEPSSSLDDAFVIDPLATPETTTTYNFLLGTGLCTIERDITITVIDFSCEPPFVFLPTAFTPNNDGENDVLYVRSNIIESMTLIIYNRWGEEVFESNDVSIGWDGTYQGDQLPPDVYGYYLNATCIDGQTYTNTGNITLLR